MKIAVIGSIGTAKNVLGHSLAACSETNDIMTCLIDDLARTSIFPSLDRITIDAAHFFVADQISKELNAKAHRYDNIICLSSAIDPLIYVENQNFKQSYDELWEYADKWMNSYDVILYVTPPNHEMAPTDDLHMYQEKIDDGFHSYLESIFNNYLKTNIYTINTDDIFAFGPMHALIDSVGDEDWIRNFL